MSLSRDFVYAFLLGQIQSGIDEITAKQNFTDWVSAQNESVVTPSEKQSITSDLNSYSVVATAIPISKVLGG